MMQRSKVAAESKASRERLKQRCKYDPKALRHMDFNLLSLGHARLTFSARSETCVVQMEGSGSRLCWAM
jgi:hypothetical protein